MGVVVVYFVIKRSDKFLVKSVIFKTFNKWSGHRSRVYTWFRIFLTVHCGHTHGHRLVHKI